MSAVSEMKTRILWLVDGEAEVPEWVTDDCLALLRQYTRSRWGESFTCEAVTRVLKTAQTIAQMDGSGTAYMAYLAEALQYECGGGIAATLQRGTWENGTDINTTLWLTVRVCDIARVMGTEIPVHILHKTRKEWLEIFRREYPTKDQQALDRVLETWVTTHVHGEIIPTVTVGQ